MKKRQPKPVYNPRVDRDALHRYLWERTNRWHRIRIHQQALAEQLDLTRGTVTRILGEMSRQGRLRKVEALPDNVGIYLIEDPARFSEDGTVPKPARQIKWS